MAGREQEGQGHVARPQEPCISTTASISTNILCPPQDSPPRRGENPVKFGDSADPLLLIPFFLCFIVFSLLIMNSAFDLCVLHSRAWASVYSHVQCIRDGTTQLSTASGCTPSCVTCYFWFLSPLSYLV